MKKFLFVLSVLTSSLVSIAQHPYEIIKDHDGSPILKGIISRDLLADDTSFKWFSKNLQPYTGKDVSTFAKYKDSIQLVVFLGTWCEDSHITVPKLFSLLDAAGISSDRVTLIGTDRNKKSISHLTDAFNIINVPTIIVMKDGRESGRVVEYGKYGIVEKELAEIITR